MTAVYCAMGLEGVRVEYINSNAACSPIPEQAATVICIFV